jgi:putative Mn2+ efflux pump MntP
MLGAILFLGVLAGLDNFQVCSSLGLLPVRRGQKHRLALAFAACETAAPLAGLVAGNLLHSVLGSAAAKTGPIVLLVCGTAVFVMALRQEDVTELVNGRPMLFGLPLSLSLDNLLAGVGLGSIHYPVLISALVIGLVSAAMSCTGLYLGNWLRRFVPKRADVVVGAYLCVLAVRMIFAEGL